MVLAGAAEGSRWQDSAIFSSLTPPPHLKKTFRRRSLRMTAVPSLCLFLLASGFQLLPSPFLLASGFWLLAFF
jgi:hypothetical protein